MRTVLLLAACGCVAVLGASAHAALLDPGSGSATLPTNDARSGIALDLPPFIAEIPSHEPPLDGASSPPNGTLEVALSVARAAVPEGKVEEGVSATPVPSSPSPLSATSSTYPVRVQMPAIGLNSPIQQVGINDKGDMDVPDGRTDNVGWYKYGVLPGNTGSAVLAAHVYAAFSELHRVKAGDEIYVTAEDGSRLRYVVTHTKTHRLSDLTSDMLFNRNDGGKHLHVITCAGSYVRSLGTYDHRLVVYATLAH